MRIKFFLAAVAAAACFTACSKDDTVTTTSSNTAANPEPIAVTACTSATGIAKVICLAEAFKSQLDATQLATVQRTYSVAEAKKWSNLPQGLVSSANKRVGLNFGAMTTTQIQYAKALIKEVAGTAANEGWDEIQQIINADEYLAANGGGTTYGAGNYYIALLGTPALTGTFEIQFGGHHLAVSHTYKDGVLVGATPSFRAVEPFAVFNWNGTSNQPLVQEKDALSAMLNGLSSSEQTTARLSSTFSDILLGPQQDGAFPATPVGIKGSNLSAAQKALVLAAIQTYVGDVDAADAATIMAKYASELDNTYVSFSGTTAMTTRNDYARIDGPSVWIEYTCQNGIVLSPTHPHSVWRDKTKDYGGN
ncbi:DUF3500 domain-containing protein [Hymenobacter convexus]|uniref:DUF3500 domain-containing protein n=1 Tax=Hymenobacter sp. CA1UV-4 TaxID=3063782 RepID=UPI002713BEF6|nr:DUF3500 domain-containing protein [Hymenobacter sp. CA1UV-4]MDO7854057.1 DUF3500 domain-containing protein [Hymenobacter sp. CA1UV-4]